MILTSFGELSFFHTLTHVPVDEGAFGVHQVELVVETGPGLGDGGRVAQHANGALDLGEVTSRHHCRRLVVDADFETGWTPIDELDGPLRLDGRDGGVDVLWYDISPVQHATGHVFSVTRVALDHLVGRLEASVGDFGDGELFVVRFFSRNHWSVSGEREMDAWIWHQVSLELSKIDVQSTIESQGSGDGRNDLTNENVQGWCGSSRLSCTARRLQSKSVVQGRSKTLAWISCRNRLRDAPSTKMWWCG